MQTPTPSNIALTIAVITIIFLGAGVFLILYVNLYNKRKRRFQEEKAAMQAAFHQEMLQTRIELQEQIFKSIGQEIHDNVGQLLSLARLQLSMLHTDQPPNASLLSDIRENIGMALSDLRNISRNLTGGALQQFSLRQSVSWMIERIRKTGAIQCQETFLGIEKDIPTQKKIFLFRILQEAMQNVLNHSEATVVEFHIYFAERHIEIKVTDNGKGFSVAPELENPKGIGLQNIINRTELIGGNITIQSAINEGTSLFLKIPYG